MALIEHKASAETPGVFVLTAQTVKETQPAYEGESRWYPMTI